MLILILGSNLGNSLDYLQKARKYLEERIGQVTRFSGIYQTAPWGLNDANDFLNQVLTIKTSLPPLRCLEIALQTENELGRSRPKHDANAYESRTMDIDLLYYSNHILHSSDLVLPHPRLYERRFVLEPLNEILPDFIDPLKNKSIRYLLAECKDILPVTRLVDS